MLFISCGAEEAFAWVGVGMSRAEEVVVLAMESPRRWRGILKDRTRRGR